MKCELLAPAGDLEKLKIALMYGADAVYIGGTIFSMRANAANFSLEEIKEATKFAHKIKKKVYVTVNIIPHNKETKLLINYLKELQNCNVDAIIVSDIGVLSLAKSNTNLEIHISTQLSTTNKESVQFLQSIGATRIVLARECSKDDIVDIKQNTTAEIECFIHGAMCASYSGRCVLSNYLTNRDANRGGCSQICRWDFDLNTYQSNKNFTFCSKDLSMIDYIKDMIDNNITSLKIEGRMRSIYYIASVVSVYRKVIDNYYNQNYKINQKDKQILNNVANRDSISQFYNKDYGKNCNYYNNRMEISNQDFLAVVKEIKEEYIILEQRNYFKLGDKVEFFGPTNTIQFVIEEMTDEDDNFLEVAKHPLQKIKIKTNLNLQPYNFMRKVIEN